MVEVIVFGAVFLAMFLEAIIGFGSALLTMPLLIQLLGITTAPPAFALMGLCTGTMMLIRYRTHWNFSTIWRILAASLPAIPIGIILAGIVPQHLAMIVLGLFILAYALYALFSPRLPEIHNPNWGFLAGFASGLTHGAYAIAGPPLVIYGTARRWEPKEFKSNIQTIFFINGILIVITHLVKGNITANVLHYFAIMVLAAASGLMVGFQADRFVRPEMFRRGVLVLLIFVGISLILKT